MHRKLFLIAVACFATACAQALEGPTCSNESVVNVAKQVVAELLAKDPGYQNVFDAQKSRYQFNAIRTISKTDRTCECRASLHIDFELLEELKQVRDTDPSAWASMVSNNFTAAKIKETSIEIEYTAQLTDDNKEVYVEVKRHF